ncbi:NmrA family transcriptional regulator [Parapedobacter defluvii]|jgi:Predicted nucleoside-diphosphate-sugar epimerases|uniref:NmrA family transcriptional regulator n=1 Tax=Parapedobacter defluvii TaxID=2045106 RepID=A0ABQ1N0G8_9SPHI|nr:SDR family oxidoreductase [Parapedobacter defluvii]GGC50197.1 NmrA family transcriptional regulator [Parapedobacter defluvii]
MKILVIGGSGQVGKGVCEKLEIMGNEVIVGAPSAGIDILTGEGLKEALDGTEIVIDLSNSKSPDDQIALDFFRTAAKHLIGAEKLAHIKHHLVLSIVGTDRAQHIGYLQAKKYQEDALVESGIPYTIIRSTQFHEHIGTIIAVQGEGRNVHVSTIDYQPIALQDVVNYVVRFALEQPKNKIVEIAGPDRGLMSDFVESYLKAKGEDKVVVSNQDDKYMFQSISKSGLVPSGEFYPGKIRFDDWKRT